MSNTSPWWGRTHNFLITTSIHLFDISFGCFQIDQDVVQHLALGHHEETCAQTAVRTCTPCHTVLASTLSLVGCRAQQGRLLGKGYSCHAVQCHAAQYHAAPCHAALCHTAPCLWLTELVPELLDLVLLAQDLLHLGLLTMRFDIVVQRELLVGRLQVCHDCARGQGMLR